MDATPIQSYPWQAMLPDSKWPEKPYRGLNYLRREDRPLLAGRNEDLSVCTELLAHPETRVLMLHGATGSGKSSFMRAGLIPSLEEDGAGFEFLRRDTTDYESIFIRCTATPVAQIGAHLYRFSSQPFRLKTPKGERSLDLGGARLGACSLEQYLGLVKETEGTLLRSLEVIEEIISRTPVLIVDQSEEALTLNPGEAGVVDRVQFFQFLRTFQQTRQDARIVVALRTEYLGRFLDAVQVGYQQSTGFRHYYLNELGPDALKEAIVRPTQREDVPPWGVPYKVYEFDFDPALAGKIVEDVLAAKYSGPALPVLQLVSLGLYEARRPDGLPFRIKEADYRSMGEAKGLIVAHIRNALHMAVKTESAVSNVRDVLTRLYLTQDDGTVVAHTRSRQWAREELAKTFSVQEANALMDQLARPEILVLRLLQNVEADGSIVEKVTLGHDSIALAIERWRALDAEKLAAEAELEKKSKSVREERRFNISFACVFFLLICLLAIPASRNWAIAIPVGAYQGTLRMVISIAPELFSYPLLRLLAVLLAGVASFYAVIIFLVVPALFSYGFAALVEYFEQGDGLIWFRHFPLLSSSRTFRHKGTTNAKR